MEDTAGDGPAAARTVNGEAGHAGVQRPRFDPARLLDEARVGTLVVDASGSISYASAGIGSLLGSTAADVEGTSIVQWIAPDELDLAVRSLGAMIAEPEAHNFPMVFHVRRADGAEVEVDVLGTDLASDPDIRGVVLTVVPADDRTRYVEPIRALAAGVDHGTVVRLIAAGVGRGGHSLRPASVVSFEESDTQPRPVRLHSVRTTPAFDAAIRELMTEDSPVGRRVRSLEPRRLLSVPRHELAPALARMLEADDRAGLRLGAIGAGGRLAGVLLSAEPAAAWAGGVWTPSMEHHWHDLLDLAAVAFERNLIHVQLVHAATHDALTGVANRGHFLDVVERMSTRHALSIFYVDLDRFKEINDEWGHARGDAVLREVAGRLRSAVRPVDLVARIGGDEFAVAIADTQQDVVVDLAMRLHVAVSEPLPASCGDLLVGVSVGVAHRHGDEPLDSVFARADLALLSVKRSGRSGVGVG